MQDHLRERLTGAAILVVVVVLLVPELFHGRPVADSGANTGPAAGPPLRSYTIDLRDTAGSQPPAVASPVVAAAPVVASGTATPAPGPAAAVAPAASKTPPAAAGAAPSSPQGNAPQSGWIVQVGSFARRDYAERMVKDLGARGFAVEVAGPDDRGLFRVRSAPRAERAAAIALKQKMQASGLKPIVSKVP